MTYLYCHYCVRSYAEDAVFCSQCGRRLHAIAIKANTQKLDAAWPGVNESAAALHIERSIIVVDGQVSGQEQEAVNRTRISNRQTGWAVFGSLGSVTVIVAASLFMYFRYETNINEQVLKLQVEAKAAALAGHYEEANVLLEKAIRARPDFRAIAEDQEAVLHAAELERLSNEIDERLTNGDTTTAQSELDHLKSELNGRKEPLYEKLKEKAEGYSVELTLAELSHELDSLTTVEEHGDMLNVVNGMMGHEAETLRLRIIAGIRTITTTDVEYLLSRRNYTGALFVCNKALTWAKEDAELLALKERIKSDKETYELEEQQRIEQAMETAAEEDLINQTDAVELLAVDKVVDGMGILTLNGTLRSKATRAIYDVKITYSVRNDRGEVLASGTVMAVPDYIEPGEEMAFSATVSGIYDELVDVTVDDKTWYLD
ncbi:FxLYD domain-containing protein [Paenibacillus sp. strain BS8-2]